MTDPSSSETEYIPPNSIDHVIGSTGVLSQSQSTSVTLSPLLNGGYPLLCTVPGHWQLIQTSLSLQTCLVMMLDGHGLVLILISLRSSISLAPQAGHPSLIIMPECLDFLTGRSSSAMVNGHTSIPKMLIKLLSAYLICSTSCTGK